VGQRDGGIAHFAIAAQKYTHRRPNNVASPHYHGVLAFWR
jgi:hypothetical protein